MNAASMKSLEAKEQVQTLVLTHAPSTFARNDKDAVDYLTSFLLESVSQHCNSNKDEDEDEGVVDVLTEFFGGEEYQNEASQLYRTVLSLLSSTANGIVKEEEKRGGSREEDCHKLEKAVNFQSQEEEVVVVEERNPQPSGPMKVSDESSGSDDNDNDNENKTKPSTSKTTTNDKKCLSKEEKRRLRKEKRQSRRKDRKSKSPTRAPSPPAESAETLKAQSEKELEELDDYSSAWAECVQQNKAWGGRGHGGRGLRNVHSTSEAVRSIHLSNVSLQFAGNDLLQNATIQITEGKRYGLIGRNGVGKSTLLRRLAKKAIPGFPLHMKVLLVQQQVEGTEKTALQTLLDADVDRARLLQEQEQLETQIEQASATTTTTNDDDPSSSAQAMTQAVERLTTVLEELDLMDADSAPQRATEILTGLQFTPTMQSSPTSHLSGGWKMRLALAQALFLPRVDLLLLDEPTNHLDLHASLWLADYLATQTTYAMIVVTHDRSFMDQVCTDMIHFDHQKLKYHPGNYSALEQAQQEKAARESQILDASERQRTKAMEFIQKQQSSHAGKRGFDPNKQRQAKMIKDKKLDRMGNYREDGKRYKNLSLKKMSEDYLLTAQKVVVEADEPVHRFKFADPVWSPGMIRSGEESLVKLEDFSFGYIKGKPPLLNHVTVNLHPGSKIALVGRNGAGKSTLLRVITGEVDNQDQTHHDEYQSSTDNKHGTTNNTNIHSNNHHHHHHQPKHQHLRKGTLWKHPTLRIGHVTQHSIEDLDTYAHLTVVQYTQDQLRQHPASAELAGTTGSIRSYLGTVGLGGNKHAHRLVGSLSGGERMRLCFATVFAMQPHVLVLDEPTNHLDMETLDSLAEALDGFKGAVVIVSHNQRFLCGFCNELWVVEQGSVLVKHGDTTSFEENFAQYRSATVKGMKNRHVTRQAKAERAKLATKQRQGVAQTGGFIG